MVTVSVLIGSNLGAVTAMLLLLQGFPAANAFGIYIVMSLCALVIATQRALESHSAVRPPAFPPH